MFNEIVAIANKRVVVATDFEPYIGQTNWLSFDKAEDLGSDANVADEPWLSGMVYQFRLDGVAAFGPNNVIVTLLMADGDELKLNLDADELAIRMEDS